MRLRKRQLRWLRAKAWRIARTQWLMSFPLLALSVAGAAALGAFDARAQTPQRVDPRSFIPTPIPYVTPVNPVVNNPLQVTFILVSDPQDEAVLNAFESGLIWREILAHGTFEILLVTNPEEEAQAQRIIAGARVRGRSEGFEVLVLDRRQN
jgi:hypothetical protein